MFSELAGRRGRNVAPGTSSPVLSVPAPFTSPGTSTVPCSGSTFPTADDEAGADNATVFMGAGPRVRPNAQTEPKARVRAASMVPRNLRAGAIGWLKTRSIELPATCIPALICGSLYGIILADLHRIRGAFDECSEEQRRAGYSAGGVFGVRGLAGFDAGLPASAVAGLVTGVVGAVAVFGGGVLLAGVLFDGELASGAVAAGVDFALVGVGLVTLALAVWVTGVVGVGAGGAAGGPATGVPAVVAGGAVSPRGEL